MIQREENNNSGQIINQNTFLDNLINQNLQYNYDFAFIFYLLYILILPNDNKELQMLQL